MNDDDMTIDPWPMEEYFRDNPVAHLVRAGYNVTVLCLHGDNSDYVRMNGMGWPGAGFVYGIHFDYPVRDSAAAARYGIFLSSLAQHDADAIALQWQRGVTEGGGKELTVFRQDKDQAGPPRMRELMATRVFNISTGESRMIAEQPRDAVVEAVYQDHPEYLENYGGNVIPEFTPFQHAVYDDEDRPIGYWKARNWYATGSSRFTRTQLEEKSGNSDSGPN